MKMKKTLTILTALLAMAACTKDPATAPTETVDYGHNIFYTVAGNAALSIIIGDGTTVHLGSEAEWDALLDSFCDRTRSGEQVMFCTAHRAHPQAKGNGTDTPTSITTADRGELKTWMKEMEKAGKTVIVSYDDNTGNWNGMAYANLAPADAQVQECSGELTFIPTPELQSPAMGGLVWALRTDTGSTLVLTVEGAMLWFDRETPDDTMTLLEGPATLHGTVSSHTDLGGDTFLTLDLEVPEDGIITF